MALAGFGRGKVEKWHPPASVLESIPASPCFSSDALRLGNGSLSHLYWTLGWLNLPADPLRVVCQVPTAFWASGCYLAPMAFRGRCQEGSSVGCSRSQKLRCLMQGNTLCSSGRSFRFVSYLSIMGFCVGMGFMVRLSLSLSYLFQCGLCFICPI